MTGKVTSSTPLWLMVLISFTISIQPDFAQTVPFPPTAFSLKSPMIRVSMENGKFLRKRGPFFNSVDENGNFFNAIKAFSLEYGWQMYGGKEWHQTCKYPRVGVGVHYMRIMDRNDLGHPFSIYAFYDGNYLRSKNFAFTNKVVLGLATGFTNFDPQDDLPNDVISTKLNSYVQMGLGFSARLSEHLYLEPGFRLSHYSNGNIIEPQKGMNIVTYEIGIRSVLGDMPVEPLRIPIDKCQHRHEVYTFLAVSSRQMEFRTKEQEWPAQTFGVDYLMANLHAGYNYELSRRIKLSAGVDFIYDGTNGQQEIVFNEGKPDKYAVQFQDKMGISIFLGWETIIDRLSIVSSLGYMVAQTRFPSTTPAFQQRLGFKYHFYRDFFAGIYVRAYKFQAAKAVEYNIGFRRYFK